VAPLGLAGDHHDGVPDARLAAQHRLDLGGLDAEAAQLDLTVEPAEELQGTVGAPPAAVAGAVQPAQPVDLDEALGAQRRIVEIAARQAVAAQVQLARHPDRHRSAPLIEQVRRRVGDRPPDRDGMGAVRRDDGVAAGKGGVLGRAIAVDQPATRQRFQSLADM
jgi:hypothetical protein